MPGITPDYSKRDCSLPLGCKDLIDVLKLQRARQGLKSASHAEPKVIELKGPVTVRELAALLGCKPFQIIAELLGMKEMASVNQSVTFEVAARVAGKYGIGVRWAA